MVAIFSWPQCVKITIHNDAMTWKPFLQYWPYVCRIHWPLLDSPNKRSIMQSFNGFFVVEPQQTVEQTVELLVIWDAMMLTWCHWCNWVIRGGRFKNAYELLNLRALKISILYKNHAFQCMSMISVWNFKGYLWNSTQNILPIHWKM